MILKETLWFEKIKSVQGHPWLGTHLPIQEIQVSSLVKELTPHMLIGN